ncbi:hypothetical protein SAMN04488057_118104, partial [Cyclobacterium lianum]
GKDVFSIRISGFFEQLEHRKYYSLEVEWGRPGKMGRIRTVTVLIFSILYFIKDFFSDIRKIYPSCFGWYFVPS